MTPGEAALNDMIIPLWLIGSGMWAIAFTLGFWAFASRDRR